MQPPGEGAQAQKKVETESKEAWGPKLKADEGGEKQELKVPVHADREHTKDWENTGLSKVYFISILQIQ